VTQLPRRDTEPGSAILGFRAGEFGELAFITLAFITMAGIFSIKRLVKGVGQREENWKKEGGKKFIPTLSFNATIIAFLG